jgi:hypothetical protein
MRSWFRSRDYQVDSFFSVPERRPVNSKDFGRKRCLPVAFSARYSFPFLVPVLAMFSLGRYDDFPSMRPRSIFGVRIGPLSCSVLWFWGPSVRSAATADVLRATIARPLTILRVLLRKPSNRNSSTSAAAFSASPGYQTNPATYPDTQIPLSFPRSMTPTRLGLGRSQEFFSFCLFAF